jgi:3-hydroxyacyl-CoA dehydrogenase
MKRIAIVGCGLVGASWCIVFARAGYDVVMFDLKRDVAEAAVRSIGGALPELAAQGLLNGHPVEEVSAHLRPVSSLAAAVADVDYVQESAPERLEIKQPLYVELDRLVGPETVICSSTSGFPSSSFTAGLACRARCMVAHPLNPPHLIPLVELVPASWTDPGVIDRVEELMHAIGQSPIRLTREINGFVVNRLQSAILAEAFRLVEEDTCGVADVDAAMAQGLGLRWFFMGPFETIDLNAPEGVTSYCAKLGPMFEGLAREQAVVRPWTPALVEKIERQRRAFVTADALAARRAWRDASLAAYVVAKRRVIEERGA